MRHDPAGAALIIMLRSLKMRHAEGVLPARRMAQAVQDLHDRAMVRHWFKNHGEGSARLRSRVTLKACLRHDADPLAAAQG